MLKYSGQNMSLSGGCLDEITTLERDSSYQLDPEYVSVIAGWLAELQEILR